MAENMSATKEAEEILTGKSEKAPKGGVDALRISLVEALVKMGKAERIGATKNLARHLTRFWSGKAMRAGAVGIIKAFGQTPEYREIYRLLITSDAWRGFSKVFIKDLLKE
jgi:hypothetical protein